MASLAIQKYVIALFAVSLTALFAVAWEPMFVATVFRVVARIATSV